MKRQFIKGIPRDLSEPGHYSVICCMLQIINWRRFQLKIFDFTLSQQTISKLFVFILTLKSQHTKTRLKSFVRLEHFKGKIIYFYPLTPTVLTVTESSQWLMETLFAPKKFQETSRVKRIRRKVKIKINTCTQLTDYDNKVWWVPHTKLFLYLYKDVRMYLASPLPEDKSKVVFQPKRNLITFLSVTLSWHFLFA